MTIIFDLNMNASYSTTFLLPNIKRYWCGITVKVANPLIFPTDYVSVTSWLTAKLIS
jgi:hypothetical protein